MSKEQKEMPYGPVFVTGGRFKGRVMYYDDDDRRTAICYTGHPIDFAGCYGVGKRFIREVTIDDLLARSEAIGRSLRLMATDQNWTIEIDELHELWSEKSLISETLYQRRMFGEMEQIAANKQIFLCHSSADKGTVRMVNDDLRHLGAQTWLDENNIKVGESIVAKISEGLKDSQFMVLFLSPKSVESVWTTKEWQSFLHRQLSGNTITVLPALLEHCQIPAILADLKYADFTNSYHDGLKQLGEALS